MSIARRAAPPLHSAKNRRAHPRSLVTLSDIMSFCAFCSAGRQPCASTAPGNHAQTIGQTGDRIMARLPDRYCLSLAPVQFSLAAPVRLAELARQGFTRSCATDKASSLGGRFPMLYGTRVNSIRGRPAGARDGIEKRLAILWKWPRGRGSRRSRSYSWRWALRRRHIFVLNSLASMRTALVEIPRFCSHSPP